MAEERRARLDEVTVIGTVAIRVMTLLLANSSHVQTSCRLKWPATANFNQQEDGENEPVEEGK